MTYDVKVYDISVSITLSEDNKLVATVVMNGHINENPVAEFVNTYHADIPDTPQTGDNSNITFWFILMLVSGAACVVLLLPDRKYTRVNH